MDKYITHHRFDLMAKYLYLKYYKYTFYQELYQKHIITFNQAWEHPGNKSKIEDFIQSFEKLIESMKKFGFVDKTYFMIKDLTNFQNIQSRDISINSFDSNNVIDQKASDI